MANGPYVIAARAGVEDSDGGAESVGETLARDFLSGLGLGPVTTQFSVAAGGSVHFVDLRVGRHLVEFDGRVKYQRRDQGGVPIDHRRMWSGPRSAGRTTSVRRAMACPDWSGMTSDRKSTRLNSSH